MPTLERGSAVGGTTVEWGCSSLGGLKLVSVLGGSSVLEEVAKAWPLTCWEWNASDMVLGCGGDGGGRCVNGASGWMVEGGDDAADEVMSGWMDAGRKRTEARLTCRSVGRSVDLAFS
ncbi:hypothetical protein L1887_58623 [Cichorium endivia]|nr:hypothetical protein L1887_58623 [Cichorium endivia]